VAMTAAFVRDSRVKVVNDRCGKGAIQIARIRGRRCRPAPSSQYASVPSSAIYCACIGDMCLDIISSDI
jgi:hypothetical protein